MTTIVQRVEEVSTVVAGYQGPQGPQGAPGVPGLNGTSDKSYHHIQGLPSATWVITHNLDKYPSILIIDSGGSEVVGAITYNTTNQLTLSFSGGFSGDAYLN